MTVPARPNHGLFSNDSLYEVIWTRSWEREMFVKDLVAIEEKEACVQDDFQGIQKEGILHVFVNLFNDVKTTGFMITHAKIVGEGVHGPRPRIMGPIFDGEKQK
jgi:hypothetical protein